MWRKWLQNASVYPLGLAINKRTCFQSAFRQPKKLPSLLPSMELNSELPPLSWDHDVKRGATAYQACFKLLQPSHKSTLGSAFNTYLNTQEVSQY